MCIVEDVATKDGARKKEVMTRERMLIELEESNHRLEVIGNKLEDMRKKNKAFRERLEQDDRIIESLERRNKEIRELLDSI